MEDKAVQQHKEQNKFDQFYKKIEAFVPDLKNFLTGSLRNAEDQGLLDRGFYQPEEIMDELFLETYKEFAEEKDVKKLRRTLYRKSIQKIETKEAEDIPDEVNTHALLKQELKALSEDFTAEGDGDRILMEDLDDISYMQKKGWNMEVRLSEMMENQLVKKFDLHEEALLSEEKKKILGILYTNIPERSKVIVELFAFGHQDTHEISEILEVPERVVERVLFKVKERFKLL